MRRAGLFLTTAALLGGAEVTDRTGVSRAIEQRTGRGLHPEATAAKREAASLPDGVSLEKPLSVYISLQTKGEPAANARYALLKALAVVHLNEVTESVLLTAGRWKARCALSLADALIASFAWSTKLSEMK